MRTYEELLAAQTELAHFNKYHDPSTGQFTSKNGVSSRPIKDKPGTPDTASTNSAKERENQKFNKKVTKIADKMVDHAGKAYSLYRSAMSSAIRGAQGDSNSKKAAGLAYEAAMRNRKLMNKYIKKLQDMGAKVSGKGIDQVNNYHVAAGEGFIKRSLLSRFADYVVPFWGYANPSDYKINEEFVKKYTG